MLSNRKQPIVQRSFSVLLVFLQGRCNSVRGSENLRKARSRDESFNSWRKPAIALLLSVVSIGSAEARTWRVKADRTGDAPTIQAAIDTAIAGDSIRVSPGIYDENLDTQEKELFLVGEAGAEATVIDGGRRARVLLLSGGGLVEGLTLRGGQDVHGGGIQVAGPAPAILRNNIIEDNIGGFVIDQGIGGGVWLDSFTAGVVVESNMIRNNIAGDAGGGLYDGAGLLAPNEVRDNVIVGNACHNNGGGIWVNTALVVGNSIADNWSDNGAAGLFANGIPGVTEVVNNTIIGNKSGNTANVHGVGIMATCSTRIAQNIVAYNKSSSGTKGAAIWVGNSVLGSSTIECNVIWGNDIDAIIDNSFCSPTKRNNVIVDPEFCAVDPAGSLNIFLQRDSPCAPGNLPGGASCGQIGAAPVGCGPVSVEERAWGQVKNLYR